VGPLSRAVGAAEADLAKHDVPFAAFRALLVGCSVLWRKWRAMADEDGQYCFAVAL
jgi:hypothetical protein